MSKFKTIENSVQILGLGVQSQSRMGSHLHEGQGNSLVLKSRVQVDEEVSMSIW